MFLIQFTFMEMRRLLFLVVFIPTYKFNCSAALIFLALLKANGKFPWEGSDSCLSHFHIFHTEYGLPSTEPLSLSKTSIIFRKFSLGV